jgi:hypothetical protein
MVCEALFRFSLALTVGSDADIERTRLRNQLIISLSFVKKGLKNLPALKTLS